jgi:hypothetical protein
MAWNIIMKMGEIISFQNTDVLDGLGRFAESLVLAPMTSLILLTERVKGVLRPELQRGLSGSDDCSSAIPVLGAPSVSNG